MAKGMNTQKAPKKAPTKTPKEKKEKKEKKRKQAMNNSFFFEQEPRLASLLRLETYLLQAG